MKQNLLLLEDVVALGKKGEIVSVKSGYSRNFLIPQGKGVVAQKNILRLQEKLQEERKKQAVIDRKDSEEMAKKLESLSLSIEVKTDTNGHMYGSVANSDLVDLFAKEGLTIDKRFIKLPKPIKRLGKHTVHLTLKEEVEANVSLEVLSDSGAVLMENTPAKTEKEEAAEKAEELVDAENNAEEAKEEE